MHTLTRRHIRLWIGLIIATACSLALTIITITPPIVAGDWARLNQFGKYIPNPVTYHWPPYALQFSLWIALTLALCWGLSARSTSYIPNIPNRSDLRYTLLLTLVTLIGFGLRLYNLDRLPLLVDEIGFAARASDMLHGQHIPILAPGHNGNPAAFSWMLAGSMALFGQTRFAIRLIPLVFGTLSIPALYIFGRIWWSRRIGLIAALFAATYPAHIYFSRLALYNIVDPVFALMALALLGRALRHHRPTDFLWAGICAGTAQYFYHGSHLLPLLMAVYILVHIRTGASRPRGSHLAILILAFILLALPRFAPMFMAHLPVTGNLNTLRLPLDLGANALRSLLAWVGQPDISPFWLSTGSLLPLLAQVALLAGFIISVRRLRDPRHAVLIATVILTTIFGGVIWTASPLYVRYMTALPAIGLLVALPFQTRPLKTNRWSWLIVILIAWQGIVVSLHQSDIALARVPPTLWEQDSLAQAAAQLPTGIAARFTVSAAFGTVDRITIADYVAAYGTRRAVTVMVK